MSRSDDEDAADVDVLEDDTSDEEGDESAGGPIDPIDAHFDAVDERVERLCDTVLKPRLAALEADRLRVRNAARHGLILTGVPFVLFFFSDAWLAMLEAFGGGVPAVRFLIDHPLAVFLILTSLIVAYVVVRVVIPGTAAHLNYRRRFKNEVVVELFKALRPHDTYQPDHHVRSEVVERSGLFSTPFGSFAGDDLMRGRVGTVEFEASEVRAHSRLMVSSGKKHQSTFRSNVTRFQGAFFQIGLDRTLKGHTIVEPEDAQGRLPRHRKGFEQVGIDDESFRESFRVYSTDPAEAISLLTPRLRDRLLKISDCLSQTPFLAFVGDRAFFAGHSGQSLLEPTIARPVSYGILSTMAEYFALPEALVHEVGLASSATAFATGARTSVLAQPAAAGLVMPDKPLEAGDLLTFGTESADEQDATRRPPPESRVRVSPLTTEGLTATYGLTPSFFVRLAWTLALTPFVAGGIARLAAESGRETLDSLTAQIPLVAVAAEWASRWPVAFAAIAFVFYVLPTWALLHLPRGVRIERAGVRVSKRLWPLAKVYPIDRIADVRVSDRQVILMRKDASLLRRMVFPAPPMRSTDEARWLAAQFRRAIAFFGGLRP